ncbi:MAG: ornithine cyclodeaminase family protein [Actinomycetota bacterium]
MRILDSAAVDSLLTPGLALDAMRDLFGLTDAGAIGYARSQLTHPRGWQRILPGYIAPMGVVGFKVLHRTKGEGMRYTIYVHDLQTGALTGLVDGLEITNLRTGAVSALATAHLAAEPVEVAAMVGTGPVARGQLAAMDMVRPAKEVRVFARTPENRRRFIREMSPVVGSRLTDAVSLEEAIEGASLVTLATKATEPILFSHHLSPGVHVNSVGPASRDRVEVDPAAFPSFDRVACDSIEQVMDEAGDAYLAVKEGHFDPAEADDLAALVTGAAPGRASADEITLFKSVGTGLQDLMVAERLLQAAEEAGVGRVEENFVSIKPVGPPSARDANGRSREEMGR